MKVALAWVVAWLAFASVASTVALAQEAEAAAKAAADRFYTACLKLKPSGLPTDEQMTVLAPLLCQDLVAGMAAARKEQQTFMRQHPDEKPPFIEGNLFASSEEGVSTFAFGAAALNNGKASLPVYLEYREGGQVVRWIDVIVLEQVANEWRVWDIFMTAPWSFRSGPSLRAMLPAQE